MNEAFITVPLTPPSVNHYVKHTRKGRHYITGEAKAFMDAVAIFARGQIVRADAYEVTIAVWQGKGERGDCDNMLKVCLDGLQKAGVIHSDAAVTELHIAKRRDAANPRTDIKVRGW